MKTTVRFYAQLKDFFGDAQILELPEGASVKTLCEALGEKNALAVDWLKVSRVASEDAFLPENHPLENGRDYFVLPPSSGG